MSASTRTDTFDAYADTLPQFAKPIFALLRALVRATWPAVGEGIKWGHPHFAYKDTNLCIFAAYAKHCRFSFAKDSLMADARLKTSAALSGAKRLMGKLTSPAD